MRSEQYIPELSEQPALYTSLHNLTHVPPKQFLHYFCQRAAAAFFAISRRRRAERLSARACPPFRPPSLPRATAAGFFVAPDSSGDPSSFSPIACSTTRRAVTVKSCAGPSRLGLLERLGMSHHRTPGRRADGLRFSN